MSAHSYLTVSWQLTELTDNVADHRLCLSCDSSCSSKSVMTDVPQPDLYTRLAFFILQLTVYLHVSVEIQLLPTGKGPLPSWFTGSTPFFLRCNWWLKAQQSVVSFNCPKKGNAESFPVQPSSRQSYLQSKGGGGVEEGYDKCKIPTSTIIYRLLQVEPLQLYREKPNCYHREKNTLPLNRTGSQAKPGGHLLKRNGGGGCIFNHFQTGF